MKWKMPTLAQQFNCITENSSYCLISIAFQGILGNSWAQRLILRNWHNDPCRGCSKKLSFIDRRIVTEDPEELFLKNLRATSKVYGPYRLQNPSSFSQNSHSELAAVFRVALCLMWNHTGCPFYRNCYDSRGQNCIFMIFQDSNLEVNFIWLFYIELYLLVFMS